MAAGIMHPVDRVSLGALAAADVGVGLYLLGAALGAGTPVHAVVGCIALVLAMPAGAAAGTGWLPPRADEGVLVNTGVMSFMVLEVLFVPGDLLQRIGLAVLIAAATAATIALYLRLVRVLRAPAGPGRHASVA